MSDRPPSAELIEHTLDELNRALKTHGGRVEQVGAVEHDVLRLRLGGMCAGCLYKPITTRATLAPFIRERLGLRVEVEGARISEEAEERLAAALAKSYDSPL